MINIIISLLISATNSYAGSICNDGTYSHSEGRGTCSHHGGVSTSGVYYDYNSHSASASVASQRSNSRWIDSYGVSDGGIPYYITNYIYEPNNTLFGYMCFTTGNSPPGEVVLFIIRYGDLLDQPSRSLAPSDAIKVLAHTNSGYKTISGSWEWSAEDGLIKIYKLNEVMDGLAEPLTKADMANIVSSNHFVVSVDGIGSTVILAPGIKSKIINTWSKCSASNK
jgi:hypothetical protein